MTVRLYGRSLGQSSHAQVSRGFRDALQAAGLLAGEYALDVEPPPEEPPRPGAAAPHGVWTGPLGGLELMQRAGRHERRWVMVAPNSDQVPPNILKALEAHATEVMVPSSWARSVMRQLTSLPLHRVPHGLPADMKGSPTAWARTRREYLRELTFRIVHFSTSDRQRKGTTELLAAWRLLGEREALPKHAQLFLVLDVPALNKLLLEESLPPGVVAHPRMNASPAQMAVILSTAHLVCQPSRAEAFGLVPLESRAVGTPIVATACTGHAEHVVEGQAGTIVIDHGPEAPIDDWLGAFAPSVTPNAIARAIETAYKRWLELKREAEEVSAAVRAGWAWNRMLAPWVRELKGDTK